MLQCATRRAASSLFSAVPPSIILAPVRMSSSVPKYDVVVFGATGYTGQFVVEEVARVAEQERLGPVSYPALQWAIAGRNKGKLLAAIQEARKETGLALENVDVLEADVSNQSSIDAMTTNAKVIINCVGPYVRYGEQVVSSCVENCADHVDISGEPRFLEGMQLKYDAAAEAKGVHIVGACGYDSIPPEIGMVHLGRQFPGGLNSVESYCRIRGGTAPVHTGTLESAMGAVADYSESKAIRRQLYPNSMPKPDFKAASRSLVHFNSEAGLYGVPFESDVPVVYRTQRYRTDVQERHPVQFKQYLTVKGYLEGFGLLLGFLYFAVMSFFSFTRNLVLKYPSAMTAGFFSAEGAKREDLKKMQFITTLVGKGWSTPMTNPGDKHTSAPDTTKLLTVTGPDPGYTGTAQMMVASAMTLLREKKKCTAKGGVLTPGVTFENTGIKERLEQRGITFEVKDV